MMRIGLISGEYPPMQGGVADFTRTLGRAFVGAGHEVFVLTGRDGVGRGDRGIHVSADVTNWNRACLRAVQRWAAERELAVVNLQYQTAAYQMAGMIHLLPRLKGSIPLVVTFHDLRVPYLFPKAGPLRERAVLALARGADAAIVTNPEDERQLALAGGVTRLRRIPIGSNIGGQLPDHFDRTGWRDRVGIGPGDILIGYFGFLNRSKGVETLLHALARLREQGQPCWLVMIGGRTGDSDPTNAAYALEIEALVDRLGLADRVMWTGYLEPGEVSAYLVSCDMLALPYEDGASFRRGSLMAALEHGCPVVTTQPAVAMPELRDGENICLVPPGDAASLAVAVTRLAGDHRLRAALGAGARRLYQGFAWENIADLTLALFGEVSGKFV